METLRKKPFDPDGEYVVVKDLKVSNAKIVADPTKLFDKGLVSGRTLRQLYEQNWLDYAIPELIKKPHVTKRVPRRRFADGSS